MPNIKAVEGIAVSGYIYENLFVNIVCFIPFVGYFLIKNIKNKKIEYSLVYFVTLIIYIAILYIGTKVEKVSDYYFYKNAYILWSIILIYFFCGVVEVIKKYKKAQIITITYVVVYVFLLGISITTNKYKLSIFDLYYNNRMLINEEENLMQDDIDMLSYIYEKNLLDKTTNNVLFIGNFMQEAWIRSIFQYRNRYPLERSNHYDYIDKWNNKETTYLVCFEKTKIYRIVKSQLNEEEDNIIYRTKNAKLYKN